MTLAITIYETAKGVYATTGQKGQFVETPNHDRIKAKAAEWIAAYLKEREVPTPKLPSPTAPDSGIGLHG